MTVLCAAVLVVFVLGVGISVSRSANNAWTPGGDFVAFYAAGLVLNEGHGDRLYDLAFQQATYARIIGGTGFHLPFSYPPIVASIFRPLALLPFDVALVAFEAAVALAYLGLLLVLVAQFGPRVRSERTVAVLAGLSFFPFLGYTWLGGQISVIGLGAVVIALRAEDRGRPFWSGCALSACMYKPSLLILILPMLAVTNRWRQLCGFIAGASLFVVACLTLEGSEVFAAFFTRTVWMVEQATVAAGQYDVFRYVDINAFDRIAAPGRPFAHSVGVAVMAALAGIWVGRVWWCCRHTSGAGRQLIWAVTLAWTPVLNIYTPFYDAILVVPACVLATSSLRTLAVAELRLVWPAIALVYLVPWVSESLARTAGIQLFTIALAVLGVVTARACLRACAAAPGERARVDGVP